MAQDVHAEESGVKHLLSQSSMCMSSTDHSMASIHHAVHIAGEAVRSHFSQNGIQCSFETGKLAPLSDGSCLVKCGQTWVLASVSCSEGFRMRDRTSPNVTVSAKLQMILSL